MDQVFLFIPGIFRAHVSRIQLRQQSAPVLNARALDKRFHALNCRKLSFY
jgi:hypothetical protein